MVPDKNDNRWEKLIRGEISHNFKAVAVGLMLSRLNRSVKRNNTPENIISFIDEVHSFFVKYESILLDDINTIFK